MFTMFWRGLVCLLALAAALPAAAQAGRGGRSGGAVEAMDHAVVASGLTAAFPAGFECPAVASPFASPSRFDGSARRGERNGGLHGGLDLSLPEGTPLLAVAAGEVIATGAGGALEGLFLWLRHAPDDTGLPSWVFSKYQHLSAPPDLAVGDRVRAGQPVALSGSTGTAGRHYGPAGYPHLHLTTFYAAGGDYALQGQFGSRAHAAGAVLDDPLILYLRPAVELPAVRRLPAEARTVAVAVVDAAGDRPLPASRTVWPVACRRLLPP